MHQENLEPYGESDEQREIKEHPIIGLVAKPYMDWKYGRISGKESIINGVANVGTEVATVAAGGAVFKGAAKGIAKTYKFGAAKLLGVLSKSKSARMVRFGENLSEGYSSKKVVSASASASSDNDDSRGLQHQ